MLFTLVHSPSPWGDMMGGYIEGYFRPRRDALLSVLYVDIHMATIYIKATR